jgi:putative transposase
VDGPVESLSPTTKTSSSIAGKADVWSLFQQLLPLSFFWMALGQAKVRENNRVYHSGVVIWLMICQRLQVQGTLETVLLELLSELPASFWPHPCKRLKMAAQPGGSRLSKQTGAYNHARQGLSLPVVERCLDHAVQQLMVSAGLPEQRRPAFFFDGTTVRMPHCEELVKAYPPTCNQHGESHWPLLRMLVAHDLYTGMGMRPEWGPVNGPRAVSEQGLLERVIGRLPDQAIVVADANFGVFSVAYALHRHGQAAVLRLTAVRAMHLAGGVLQDGTDQVMHWKPTREDRRAHPELPAEACVRGRLIVRQVLPSNGAKPFLLALFTTLEDAAEQIVEWYGKRWNIEVDLRTLKGELKLEQLTCTSVEMVAKEIDVAMLAYNLVRAVMFLTAERTGLEPRAFSFTQVKHVLQAFLPRILADPDERSKQRRYADMLYYLDQCRLRRRERSGYPRAVWIKPKAYPSRHC